jgi:hypothetical protein
MQFLPNIQKAGDAIEKWFGDRLPGILNFLTPVVKQLGGFFGDIGRELGKVIDYTIAHEAEFRGFFTGLLGFFSGTFKGFMDSMMNVATWFEKNWPAISKAAGDAARNIGEGFSPWVGPLKTVLGDIGDRFRDIGRHVEALRPLQTIFGFLAGGVITGIVGALDGFLGMLQLISAEIRGLIALKEQLLGGGGGNHGGYWQNEGRGKRHWVPYTGPTGDVLGRTIGGAW